MNRFIVLLFTLSSIPVATSPAWDQAHELCQRTEYQQSLALIPSEPHKDAPAFELIGESRAYGRRAETGGPSAPDLAVERLRKYLNSPLTADDPPRTQAEALLGKTGV
jgi:hypothetical protein